MSLSCLRPSFLAALLQPASLRIVAGERGATRSPASRRETMGLFTKDIETFDDLFLHQLQDIYYAENQITKALPKMIEKATAPELKEGFQTHLTETEGQIRRLEQVFQLIGKEPKAVTCPAIDGIIKEANEVAGEIADKQVLDAALIAAAQAVEHYEITRYGTLISWATQLGLAQAAQVLGETLAEERATDEKLTAMAESKVNPQAEMATA
jgi:ferritin-like metal-binding protein YciE